MAQSAGVVYITVLPNMEAFAAELDAQATEAGAVAGESAAAGTEAGLASGAAAGGAGMAGKFGNLGLLLGAAFVVGFSKKSIEAAEAVEKQVERLKIGFEAIGEGGMTDAAVGQLKAVSDQTVALQADTDKVAASILNVGHNYFNSLGPAASTVLAGLTKGILNVSAATGKPLAMLQRSLTLAVVNTPDKAIATLQKMGIATSAQAAQWTKMAKAGDIAALRTQEITAITNAYPGAAEASATAGDKFKKTLNDMEVTVGKFLIPAMNFLASIMSTKLGKVFLGVTTATIGLLVVMSLLSKAFKFLGDNAIGKYIKSLTAKKVADEESTVATQEATTANEELAVAEGEAGAGAVESGTQMELFAGEAETAGTAAEGAAASFTLMQGALGGLAAGFVGFKIGEWINKVTGFSEKFDYLLGQVDSHFKTLSGPEVTQSVNDQMKAFQDLQAQLAAGTISNDTFTQSVAAINEQYGTNISATYLAQQAMEDHTAAVKEARKAEQEHERAVASANKTIAQANSVLGADIKTLKDARTAYNDFAKNAGQSMNFVTGSLGDLLTQQHETARGLAHDLDQQARKMKTFSHNLDVIAKDGGRGTQELINQLLAAGPAGADMAAQIANASKTTRQHIENDIGQSLKNANQDGKDLASQLTGGFNKIAASILVVTGKATDLQDALNQLNGTDVTTTVTTDYKTGRGRPPGGPHRAAGGTVHAGVPYVVGEQRPEVFIPDRSGSIVANPGTGSGTMKLVLDDGTTFNAYLEEAMSG